MVLVGGRDRAAIINKVFRKSLTEKGGIWVKTSRRWDNEPFQNLGEVCWMHREEEMQRLWSMIILIYSWSKRETSVAKMGDNDKR